MGKITNTCKEVIEKSEWLALATWSVLGLALWLARRPGSRTARDGRQ